MVYLHSIEFTSKIILQSIVFLLYNHHDAFIFLSTTNLLHLQFQPFPGVSSKFCSLAVGWKTGVGRSSSGHCSCRRHRTICSSGLVLSSLRLSEYCSIYICFFFNIFSNIHYRLYELTSYYICVLHFLVSILEYSTF